MGARQGVATASGRGGETPLTVALRAALARSGLRTRTALAHAADLDPSYVARLLRGAISRPTLPTLRRLADALHAPLTDLAIAAGYPVVAAAPPPVDAAPPTLAALVALLRADPAFMARLEALGPADHRTLRALAAAWTAQADAIAACARPVRGGGDGHPAGGRG